MAAAQPIYVGRSIDGRSEASLQDPGAVYRRSAGGEMYGPWSDLVTGGVGYPTFGTNFRASQQSDTRFDLPAGDREFGGSGAVSILSTPVADGGRSMSSAGSRYEYGFVLPAGETFRFEAMTSDSGVAQSVFARVSLLNSQGELFRVSSGLGEPAPSAGQFEGVSDGSGYIIIAEASVRHEALAGGSADAGAAWDFAMTIPAPGAALLVLTALSVPVRRRAR